MRKSKRSVYLTPLIVFLLLFSVSLSYTYISPYLIKVAKIISSENSQYYLDFTSNPALKVVGKIISNTGFETSGDVNTTSGRICIGNDCISSWNSLSGIPSGYCVMFYNATCPSGFEVKENLTKVYLPGWHYRALITIEENSGSTLTDYQIKITLDTQSLISAGKMRSDCGDIRFYYTNYSGTYEIPYWIEDVTCNTPNTNIWVKVPEISANGQTIVYMYYGNPDATSESSIDETFIFGDDFNNGVLDTNKWNTIDSGGSYQVINGYLSLNNWGGYIYSKNLGNLRNAVVKIKSRVHDPTASYGAEHLFYDEGGITSTWAENQFLYTAYGYSDYTMRWYDTALHKVASFNNYTWYTHIFTIVRDENYALWTAYNGTELIFSNINMNYRDGDGQYFSYISFRSVECIMDIDYIFIRKYSSSEPTVTLGTEQPNEPDYKIICCKE